MSLKMDVRMRADIERIAKARGVSASDAVRAAIDAMRDVCPTCGTVKPLRRRKSTAAQAAA